MPDTPHEDGSEQHRQLVNCHLDGHSNTMSGVQHGSGLILPRVEVDDGTVLLLVKVLVLFVDGVLRVSADRKSVV